jgi:Sec-independent protein secretion pathway component TatC
VTTTAPRPDEYVGEEMTLVEHLVELRTRLFRSALAIVGSFAIGFLFRCTSAIRSPRSSSASRRRPW